MLITKQTTMRAKTITIIPGNNITTTLPERITKSQLLRTTRHLVLGNKISLYNVVLRKEVLGRNNIGILRINNKGSVTPKTKGNCF